MTENEFTTSWSDLHGGAEISGVVRGWLWISYRVAKALHALRISPNILTASGVIAGLLTIPMARSSWAIALLVLSLLGDGLDGSLAIYGRATSKRGAIIDSVSDRITEFAWLIAFTRIGAPLAVVAGAWIAAHSQEYVRARAGGLGLREIGVVTIAERPVRASLFFIALVGYNLNISCISVVAWVWLIMQTFSFVRIASVTYRRLSLR